MCIVCVEVLPRGSFANYLLTLPTGSGQRRTAGEGREEMMEKEGESSQNCSSSCFCCYSCWFCLYCTSIGIGIVIVIG